MRLYWSACLVILAFTTSGCFLINDEPSLEEMENLFDNAPYPTVVANYDPLNAVLPYPTNLLFSGTADGTVNIPGLDETDYANPQVALNSLDGFSTIQPMTFTFSGIVDQSTIIAGDTVRVFEVDLCCGQTNFLNALSVVRELEAPSSLFGTLGEYTLSNFVSENLDGDLIDGVAITPTTPLKPATGYMVAVTRNITDLNGVPISWDLIYGVSKRKTPLVDADGYTTINYVLSDDQADLLEALRSLNSTYEDAIEPFGVASDSVALTYAFTTQSTTNMLQRVADSMTAGDYTMGPVFDPTSGAFLDSADLALPGATGQSNVFLGTIEVPYYQDPNNPSGSRWMGYQGNFPTRIYEAVSGYGPEQRNSEVIPFVATVPKNCGDMPADGWPVSIFVHTMTQNRLNLFAIGDHMAQQPYCTAGIAIDLPLHGVDMYTYDADGVATDDYSDTFLLSADAPATFGDGELGAYQNYPWFYTVRDTVHERHFNMDYDGDGKPESATAGTQFFTPAALITTRDNFRQASSDVAALATTIPTIRDTWSGTLYGLSVLNETQKMAPADASACGEVSPADICNFSPLPCCGAIRDAYDGVIALMGVAFLADQSIVQGSVGATSDALVDVGGSALSLVSDYIEPAPGVVVPTSGLIYDAIKAAAMLSMVADEFNNAANGYMTTCGTDAPSAAQIVGVVGATLDFARGADGANVADGYINAILGSIDAYTVPDMSSADLAPDGAFEDIAAASTGLEAVTAAQAYLAAAVGAVQTAVLGTGNDDGIADYANAVAAADDQIVADMSGMGTSASALVPLIGGPYPALAALATGDGNLATDVLATMSATADIVLASSQAAEAVESSGASPADLALAAAAKEAEVTAANAVVTGAATAFGEALAAYGAAAAAVTPATAAFLGAGCTDAVLGGELVAASDNVVATMVAMATAAGNTAGAVSAMADLVVNQADTADANTLIGLAATAIVQVVGQGPDAGQPVGIGTAAANAGGAVAAGAAAITAATATWNASSAFFDASKISGIGHSFGSTILMPAAAVNSSIKQVVLVGPAGGLAYAFESSGMLGQAIAEGLNAVDSGLVPGAALWESFFSVFQAAMDPADPISYIDSLDPDQAVYVIEVERDQFFPNSVDHRPLGGSSPLIDLMGLDRITASTDAGAGGVLRAAVRINADDAPVGFITYLDPTAGCATNDVACIEENDFYRSEMRNQTMSFISSGGTSVTINPITPKYGGAIVEDAN